MNLLNSYGVIILAGGKSSRMGSPKPWLILKNDVSFLEHLVKIYSEVGIKRIVVSLNHEFCDEKWKKRIRKVEKYASVVKNYQVNRGRTYSLKLGLKNLENADFVFIQNVDNPFVEKKDLEKLCRNACWDGVTIPTVLGKGGHPVLISNNIIQEILNTHSDSLTLYDILEKFDQKRIEFEAERFILNLNTPSEYKSAISDLV